MIDKKAEIRQCGRELFSEKGYKETNVAEIMKAAGMSVGTFYNYYTSKDQLFMEIYIEENVKLKRRILDSLDMTADPISIMKDMTYKNYVGMMENPILKEWYNREVFQKIEQNFREENGSAQINFLYDSFIDLVRIWQAEGKMRSDISAEMIMAIFSALVTIDLHKEEVGLQYFPQVLEYVSEFTMKGLMDTKEPLPERDA